MLCYQRDSVGWKLEIKDERFLHLEHCPWIRHGGWWSYPYLCLVLQHYKEPQTYTKQRAGANPSCFSKMGDSHQRQTPQARQ